MRKGNVWKKAASVLCVAALLVTGAPAAAEGDAAGNGAEATAASSAATGGTQTVQADCMQKIFACLTKEDSDYSKMKKETAELIGDMLTYSETVSGSTITITAAGKEDYAEAGGSWDFVLEGDYLTFTSKKDDFTGAVYFTYLIQAASEYLGMDGDLVSGYIAGLGAKGLESTYYIQEKDADGGTAKIRFYVGGAFEMPELDEWYLDADTLAALYVTNAMGDDYVSGYAQMGKYRLYYEGTRYSADIYIGEHDALTAKAYQSLVESIRFLKPLGYEGFLEDYKELSETGGDVWQASFATGTADLPEMLQDSPHYKFLKVHFETPMPPALNNQALSMKAGDDEWLFAENGEVTGWKSSDTSVAVVKNGWVTALKKGTATITATFSDGTKLTCKVTVKTDPAIKVGGKAYKKNKTYTVKKGGTLKAAITGKAGSVDNTCKSSDKKIAKVTSKKTDQVVKIKGLKKGTAKITIKVNKVGFTFKVKVK